MNLFLTVFLAVSGLYAIGFIGMICHDLYQQRGKEKQTETETIDVSGMTEEQPVRVEEPSVQTQVPPSFTEHQTEEGVRVIEPAPGYKPVVESAQDPETEPEPQPLTSQELNEKYTQGTEEIEPEFQFKCESQELKDFFNGNMHGTQSRVHKKENVLDNL